MANLKNGTEVLIYSASVRPFLEQALRETEQYTGTINDSISLETRGNQVYVTIEPTRVIFLAEFFRRFGQATSNEPNNQTGWLGAGINNKVVPVSKFEQNYSTDLGGFFVVGGVDQGHLFFYDTHISYGDWIKKFEIAYQKATYLFVMFKPNDELEAFEFIIIDRNC